MKQLAAVAAGLLVLTGCAAQPGQTDLTLHQRAVFLDGTSYQIGDFTMSEVDNTDPGGPLKVPGNEVTVAVVIQNAPEAIGAGEVTMALAYRGDQGQELTPTPIPGPASLIGPGDDGRISKTFRVDSATEMFRTSYLRLRVEVASYPAVTFSGSVP